MMDAHRPADGESAPEPVAENALTAAAIPGLPRAR